MDKWDTSDRHTFRVALYEYVVQKTNRMQLTVAFYGFVLTPRRKTMWEGVVTQDLFGCDAPRFKHFQIENPFDNSADSFCLVHCPLCSMDHCKDGDLPTGTLS